MQINKWNKSPSKITFGKDIVMADLAIDNDHIITLYLEKEMAEKYTFNVTLSEVLPTTLEQEYNRGMW